MTLLALPFVLSCSRSPPWLLSLSVSSGLRRPSWLNRHIHNDNISSDFLCSRLHSNPLACSAHLMLTTTPRAGAAVNPALQMRTRRCRAGGHFSELAHCSQGPELREQPSSTGRARDRVGAAVPWCHFQTVALFTTCYRWPVSRRVARMRMESGQRQLRLRAALGV